MTPRSSRARSSTGTRSNGRSSCTAAWTPRSGTVKRNRKAVGAETLIGREAVVITPCRPTGQVQLDGEIWEATCEAGAGDGDRVRITGRDGLTLTVVLAAAA